MKSIRNHISLIFALMAMLFSFQFLSGTNQVVSEYENYLNENYSIIAVSTSELKLASLRKAAVGIKSLEEVDPTFVIDSLKENLSVENLEYLKTTLPKFYKISLFKYPTIKERERLKEALSRVKSISKIETFAKSQNQIYELLSLNKTILIVISTLVFFISMLLMVRQMELWLVEHESRMYIMSIFGASLWQKSAVLFALSIVDSIISSLIVVVSYYYLTSNLYIQSVLEEIGIHEFRFDVFSDSLNLLALALTLSILCVMYVIIKADD